MSDCSTRAWELPARKDWEPGVLYAPELTERLSEVDAIEVDSVQNGLVRFERVRECENEWEGYGLFRCSKCWYQIHGIEDNMSTRFIPNYCPNCGARVKEGGE